MFYRRPVFKTPGLQPHMPGGGAPGFGADANQTGPGSQSSNQDGGYGADSARPMRPRWQPSPGQQPSMPGGSTGSASQQDQAYRDQMERMKAKRRGQMDALAGVQ
jgi:hypothetical protein